MTTSSDSVRMEPPARPIGHQPQHGRGGCAAPPTISRGIPVFLGAACNPGCAMRCPLHFEMASV